MNRLKYGGEDSLGRREEGRGRKKRRCGRKERGRGWERRREGGVRDKKR